MTVLSSADHYLDRLIALVEATKVILINQADVDGCWPDEVEELAELFEDWGLPTDITALEDLTTADIEDILSEGL